MLSLVLHLALAGLPPEEVAQTEPQATQVSWDAPAGCPSRSAIVSGVEVLLGDSLDADRPVVVRAEGRIEPLASDRWKLSLRISSETGTRERTLEGTTCQELGEIAIVLIAVAIDPSVDLPEITPVAVEETVTSEELEEPTEAEVIDEPEDEPEDELVADDPLEDDRVAGTGDPPSPKPPLTGFIGVSTGLLVGPLPGVAPGVHLDLGLRWRMLAVSAGVSHWFERRARLPGSHVGGDLQLTTGNVRICAVPSVRRLDVPLCTGLELGVVAGRGVGVSNPRTGRGLWAAALADLGVTFMPWRWIGFGVRAGLVVPITRPTFAFDDVGEVHRAAPAGFQGLAGIELRFP
jgi:hypothetical protein